MVKSEQNMETSPGSFLDPRLVRQPASRRPLLRDPVALERALGIVLWAALLLVLINLGD